MVTVPALEREPNAGLGRPTALDLRDTSRSLRRPTTSGVPDVAASAVTLMPMTGPDIISRPNGLMDVMAAVLAHDERRAGQALRDVRGGGRSGRASRPAASGTRVIENVRPDRAALGVDPEGAAILLRGISRRSAHRRGCPR